jgi:hypothetical protein
VPYPAEWSIGIPIPERHFCFALARTPVVGVTIVTFGTSAVTVNIVNTRALAEGLPALLRKVVALVRLSVGDFGRGVDRQADGQLELPVLPPKFQ